MQDTLFIRFHELILLVYLISIACYFYDFLNKNYRIRNFGFITLGIVWVLQTISLSIYINMTRHVPLNNIFDVFFALTWLIISISIVISVIKQLNFSIFLFNIIGFTLLALNTFQPTYNQTEGQKLTLINELLIVHVCFATLSYAVFAFAFVNCLLYLIQYRNLKEKRFTQKYFRIGSVATLEKTVFYSSLIGFILLIVSTILGAQWGVNSLDHQFVIDSKMILSIVIIVMYGLYLLCRVKQLLNKQLLIYFNIVLFGLCMVNLLFASHIPNFHQWTSL
ncbi:MULTISPECIES: cytochrome c biogenesis protein [Staphylococcus]|uniref:Cytochrome C assembly protein n=1 Tax=Staphylococcus pettenkoferi TaxID=170573 RepID=A0A1Z3TZC3_9STAP|nr:MULTISPECIES: cytochrome c biogenesis protein [Staphylococcus]ASE36280.1 cytochrome C assembly protein [Staphylococcus pettenkoferi]EHM71324.1 cytochrome c assembly protein [Staphylococcus pettenkoferi VCU012]MBX8993729.1 cytochrome c biogenesis protein CcsA [Staphylococcus pettenkoferi]MCI2790603.1 cytochrome c biogenesis protein [Staphylococcus pettenkoferi]MCY1572090.1 cytochrome c biogenesis protein [Staphylococcus pettenkoferi]